MRGHHGRSRATSSRATAIAVLTLASVLAWGVSGASAAPGDFTYQGCYTGETETGPSGTNACASVGATTASGANSGFDNVRSTVVSSDGTSLYTTASSDSSVAQFSRDPATGALTYLGCITGETQTGPTGSDACAQIPSATSGGNDSGLGGAQGIGISPDGASVYVVADNDDAIARFSRDQGTGLLSYQDCITGEQESGPVAPPPGSGACAEIASATSNGTNSGLDFPWSVTLTSTSLYVAVRGDDAVARFSRDPSTGALTYQDCISGKTEATSCTQVPEETSQGIDSGFDDLLGLGLSPDGTSLYAAARNDSAVLRLDRDLGTGALTFQGCITGEANTGPSGSAGCAAQIPSATSNGVDSGMLSMYAVAVSADGNSVYGISEDDDSLVRFDRAAGGALTYQGCITGKTEAGPTGTNACPQIPSATSQGSQSGLDKLRALVISPDGLSVFVAVPQDDSVARFAREPSGAVSYAGCLTGETQTGPTGSAACAQIPSASSAGTNSGLDNPQALAMSPNGAALYAGAANDAGIARFAVELVPPDEAPADPGDTVAPDTAITANPKKKTKKKKATFAFTGTDARAVASFQCRIDKDPFAGCTAPFKDRVKKGKHHFEVRAIDGAGNVDPTPATYDWKVKKKKRRK